MSVVRNEAEENVLINLRRLGYPYVDQFPSLDSILVSGKLRYQLLEWLFHLYDPALPEPHEEATQAERSALWAALLDLTFDSPIEGAIDGIEQSARLQLLVDLMEMVAEGSTDLDQASEQDIMFARAIICKETFSAQFKLLPEDMQLKLDQDKVNIDEIERQCVQKEALLAELEAQRQQVLQACPQSEKRISREDLHALNQRIMALNEQASRFCETYNKDLRTWIVQGPKLEERQAFQQTSRRTSELIVRTYEQHNLVKNMLDDFETIKHSIDEAFRLQRVASFMEDRDNEYLLSEERLRHLRDEAIVFDQAAKRLGNISC